MEDLQSLKHQLASYLDSGQGKLQLSLSQAVAGKADVFATYIGGMRARIEQCATIDDVRLTVRGVEMEMRSIKEKLLEADDFYAELHGICERFETRP